MAEAAQISNLIDEEKRKEKLEKDINSVVKLIENNKNKVEYVSALIKDLNEYVSHVDFIVERLEGNFGIEENILDALRKTLDELKRTATILVSILNNLPESKVFELKEEIQNLNEFVKKNFEQTIENENRVYKGKSPRTHLFEKLFGNLQKDIDIYGNIKLADKERNKEVEEEIRFKEEIDLLKQGNIPEFKRYVKTVTNIVDYYKKEFKHLFKCLWDIQEQEARNIRLIEYYLLLLEELKKDRNLTKEYELQELSKKLSAIQSKIRQYIRRDYLTENNLYESFEDFNGKFKQIEDNLEGIERKRLGFLSGEIYFKKINGIYPRKGVVVVPGMARVYKQYEPLIFRLVFEGYLVCAFDLPSQGSEGNFRVGVMSECIYECVRTIRSMGVVEVGVVGHSLGAIVALYALGGYTQEFEDYMIKKAGEFIEALKIVDKELQVLRSKIIKKEGAIKETSETYQIKIYEATDLLKDLEKEKQSYEEFKQQILTALRKTRFKQLNIAGKIDAVILLAPPESIQGAKILPKFFYKLPPRIAQDFLSTIFDFDKLVDFILKRQIVVNYKVPSGLNRNLNILRNGALEIKKSDFADFLKYLKEVPNPFDFMSILDYFSKYEFVEYYTRKYVKETPKLFLYGRIDAYLKSFIEKGTLERAYRTMGVEPENIKHWVGLGHLLKPWDWGLGRRGYIATSPEVQRDIVIFLKKVL